MKEIHLSDRLGHVTSKKIGFSWLHFFFGPFYCFARLHFILGIIELLVIYYFLPIPGLESLSDGITSLVGSMVNDLSPSFQQNLNRVLLVFRRGNYAFVSGFFLFFIHLFLSNYVMGFFLRRDLRKKQLRPVQEQDARLLIKYMVCDEKISLAESFDLRQSSSFKSAEESWYENNAKRIKGDRATRFMTRSTILFAGDKENYGKKKVPGTQTIEIESWNDNSFGAYKENLNKETKQDDEFCNFTDYSQFIPQEQKEIKEEELVLTEPVTMEIKSSDLNEGFFSSKKEDKDDFSF